MQEVGIWMIALGIAIIICTMIAWYTIETHREEDEYISWWNNNL